ncbi:MAG: polysaccharide biosynthesis/export family protein [Desulfobulbaceae bacterium]|nr:polysaccharide biosynthesis/export family protein [Desulfobulbaceae bacterium]
MKRIFFIAGLLLLTAMLSSLAGCAWAPGHRLNEDDLGKAPAEAAEKKSEITPLIPITAELIARQQAERLTRTAPASAFSPEPAIAGEYIIGPGDILSVTVWDHPELTIPAGEFRSPELAGNLVDSRGRIFYPYVGEIEVAGLTVAEVRALLAEKLSQYIKNPQIDLRVADFRSKKIVVTGEVESPNIIALTDRPLTLLEAINLAGGPTELADLRELRLSRGGEVFRIDLLAFYREGNPAPMVLQAGDQLYVPDNTDNNVYVMGEVSKSMAVPMVHQRLSLAEALSRSGGISSDNADAGQIFVFRNEAGRAAAYRLDANSADALLLATTFNLEKHDVVYVAPTGLTVWNRIVGKILPTVQTIWQTNSLIDDWTD